MKIVKIILGIIAALIPNLCAFADNAQTVNSSTVQSPGGRLRPTNQLGAKHEYWQQTYAS